MSQLKQIDLHEVWKSRSRPPRDRGFCCQCQEQTAGDHDVAMISRWVLGSISSLTVSSPPPVSLPGVSSVCRHHHENIPCLPLLLPLRLGQVLYFKLYKWWKITDAALCSGTVSFIYIMWTNYWARVAALESRYSAAADIGLGGARPGHRPPNSRHSLARIDKEEVRRSGNKTVAPVFLF